MKFQIRAGDDNIIDKRLSYEEALMYIESNIGRYYTMEPMKEDDQNDCDPL